MQLLEDSEMKGFYNNDDDDAGTTAPLWRASFTGKSVDMYFDRVSIVEFSLTGRIKNQVDFALSQIASIEIQAPHFTTSGSLRILSPGYGTTDARNAVFFLWGGRDMAEAVRVLVLDAKMDGQRTQMEMMGQPVPFSSPVSQIAVPERPTARDLVRLKALLDRGALTPEEFDQAKKAILGRMTVERVEDI